LEGCNTSGKVPSNRKRFEPRRLAAVPMLTIAEFDADAVMRLLIF
jgi:hypothetical protein